MIKKNFKYIISLSVIFFLISCKQEQIRKNSINYDFIYFHISEIKKYNNENTLYKQIYFNENKKDISIGFIIQDKISNTKLIDYKYDIEQGKYIPYSNINLEIEGIANISDFLFSIKELESLNLKDSLIKYKNIKSLEIKKPEEFYIKPEIELIIK